MNKKRFKDYLLQYQNHHNPYDNTKKKVIHSNNYTTKYNTINSHIFSKSDIKNGEK